jgi:hypothetical protein
MIALYPRGDPNMNAPPTSWHNNMLALSEYIISQHAADLIARRWQPTVSGTYALDESSWLQEVDSFIDDVLESSGAHVNRSPELLRAVQWMIAGATARLTPTKAPRSIDSQTDAFANAP